MRIGSIGVEIYFEFAFGISSAVDFSVKTLAKNSDRALSFSSLLLVTLTLVVSKNRSGRLYIDFVWR